MDEARRVLERLDRIEALRRETVPPKDLLAEVRALLAESEEWLRAERSETGAAAVALERVKEALVKA